MQNSDATSLTVEISGWDEDGQFFTERSKLEADDRGEHKEIEIRHSVRCGGLVFIRRAYSNCRTATGPEAHRVESIQPSESNGYNQLRLTNCPPRHTKVYEPKDQPEHRIVVRDEVKR